MEKLGQPKAEEDRSHPSPGEAGHLDPQIVQAHPEVGQDDPEIQEAGEGAQDEVVGKTAMAGESGVRPPQKPQDPPALGRAAVVEVQVWGEEEAST